MNEKTDNLHEAENPGTPAANVNTTLGAMQTLAVNFKQVFHLPDDATQWLLDVFFAAQIFDDYADGDYVKRTDLDKLIMKVLYEMPANAFFQRFAGNLLHLIGNAVLKWKASDMKELNQEADAKSFVWRASFYDIVLEVVRLVHGNEAALHNAAKVMDLYGEDFEEYKQEFSDA